MKIPEDRTGLRALKLTTFSPQLHFPSPIPEFLVRYGSRLEFNLCWDTRVTSLELSSQGEGRAPAQDHSSRRVDFLIVGWFPKDCFEELRNGRSPGMSKVAPWSGRANSFIGKLELKINHHFEVMV